MTDRAIIDGFIAEQDEPRQPFGAGKEDWEQGSAAWLYERIGFCTASRFKDALDFTKAGKPGAKRTAYLWEIVSERLTEKPTPHFTSAAMERGTMLEGIARMAYEARTGNIVMQTGFRKHPTIAWLGGSPDGLIDEDGGWEGKCPVNPQQHLGCFLSGMPEEHTAQVQGLMWLHDRAWWDFTSFHPDYPAPFDLYVQRIERDAEFIVNMEAEILRFLAECAVLHTRLLESAK